MEVTLLTVCTSCTALTRVNPHRSGFVLLTSRRRTDVKHGSNINQEIRNNKLLSWKWGDTPHSSLFVPVT